MNFNFSLPLITGTQEDVFQLESWGLSMAHTLFKMKCSASALAAWDTAVGSLPVLFNRIKCKTSEIK